MIEPVFDDRLKLLIITKLNEKGVKTCPMCAATKFVVADGFLMNQTKMSLSDGLFTGGPAIPTIAIACFNCGFLSQHALGVLGLLDNEGSEP